MRKFRFRLPEFDNVGLWILTLGVWFHIVSRLIRPNPSMAILLAQIIGLSLTLWGGYRILNVWIARARAAEKDAAGRRPSTGAEHNEG
ncbi:type-F conjugative transfer system pilin chaperone TraQ (plasmid) [Serratia ureilytica]|uniref:type-F conjugative transfer system pilin chaperone TraQ n=1 Tax=Serratia ureilytica TaxID=300181 RepID=UPI001CBD4260|nr:type-F conjugative transfer system pilin chaperone TraQ [Serratia ureilytica]UAN29747.1 type-F conjugative transfer system pilin chaperone TraQ [Serratia ureilytica]